MAGHLFAKCRKQTQRARIGRNAVHAENRIRSQCQFAVAPRRSKVGSHLPQNLKNILRRMATTYDSLELVVGQAVHLDHGLPRFGCQ